MNEINKPISISNEFITKAQSLYPEWKDLHNALKNGKINTATEMLEKSSQFCLTSEDVISCFEKKQEKKILQVALLANKRRALFNEFMKIIFKFKELNNAL